MLKSFKSVAVISALALAGITIISVNLIKKDWEKVLTGVSDLVGTESEEIQSDRGANKPRETAKKAKVQGVEFQILNCTSQALSSAFKVISCPYLVTSQQPDDVFLKVKSGKYSSSERARLIDNLGNEYISSRIQLGSDIHSYAVSKNLIKDVPLRGSIIFDRVPSSLQDIVLLEIPGELDSELYDGNINVRFRKVALSESSESN